MVVATRARRSRGSPSGGRRRRPPCTRTISSCTRASSPARNASREITMSISSAPAATASSVSRSLTSSDAWPDGKPVATAAARTPLPASASRATPTSVEVDAGGRRAARGSVGCAASVATAFRRARRHSNVKLRDNRGTPIAGRGSENRHQCLARPSWAASGDGGDRPRQGGVRRRPPEGDHRDGRAGSYDHVRHASMRFDGGAQTFIKTSTGKGPPPAPTPATCAGHAGRRSARLHPSRRPGGHERHAGGALIEVKAALAVLVLVKETLGDDWLTPRGASARRTSSLLDDLLTVSQKDRDPVPVALGGRGLQQGMTSARTSIVWDLRARPRVQPTT